MPIGGEAPVDPTAARWECQWPADATSLTSSERADWALSTTEKISVHADGNGTASPLPPGPRCKHFSISYVQDDILAEFHAQMDLQAKDLLLPFQCLCCMRGGKAMQIVD
ncbi:uncharacterized protein [Miscanthus floridulus]|uniref:uncharacterized protein n=1 Tax=Miscanthus floridulus TaxID=154761 RepID=UPI003458D479